MATYELYLGGPRVQNIDWAIFPAATFATSNAAALGPANKTPVVFGASRTLDFTNDVALNYFYVNTLPSNKFQNNDFVGSIVVPSNSLLIGCWWSVNNPVTGGVFSLIFRTAAATILAGQSTSAVASGWVPYLAAGNVTTGVHYFAAPDILDVKFTTVPGGGLEALSLTITPVYYNFQIGQN